MKVYCDKCKKELSVEEMLKTIEIRYAYSIFGGVVQPLHFCEKCHKDFRQYIKDYIGAEE